MGLIENALTAIVTDNTIAIGLMVFLAAGTLAFAVMLAIRARASVKKRTARILDETLRNDNSRRSLRHSSRKLAQRLLEYTNKHYSESSGASMKVLRQRLVQAGIFDPRAIAMFFLVRAVLALGLAAAVFVLLPMFRHTSNSVFWMAVVAFGIAGYVGPSMYVDKRIKAR